MAMDIGEAYEECKHSYPDQSISKSKFYNLHPQNILPVNNMPHTVCVCKSNASTNTQLLEIMCCDTNIAKSMFSECNDCMSDVKILLGEGCIYDEKLKWKEWKTIENKPISAENCTTLHKIVSHKLPISTKELSLHILQLAKKVLINLPNKVVVQLDFAENCTLSKMEFKVITGANIKSFAVNSDDLQHSKVSELVFMQSLLIELKKITPHEQIHMLKCVLLKNGLICEYRIFLLLDMERVQLKEWEGLLNELCGKQ
ncbi:hypothetical protein PR048_017887 [Dryococelus australis]|uniref:Uncharacterized protein n=1 Tax=Dryococelus australis TaxID=614101 RepID=A0ABQ9HB32_9NEOP|nr:hypothetical protein PR048_017887 [Dryococelus australis]